MEIDTFIHLALGIAIVVLAILLSKAESLAITNRTRIGRLEIAKLSEKRWGTSTVEYKLEKTLEENKSLSFQLAEVSKALQEKKLLIYDMDAKMSELDAKALKAEKEYNELLLQSRGGYVNMLDKIQDLQAAYDECKASRQNYIDLVQRPDTVIGVKTDNLDFTRQYEGQWLDSLKEEGKITTKPIIEADFEIYETEPGYTIPAPDGLESEMLRALEAEEQVEEMVDKEPVTEFKLNADLLQSDPFYVAMEQNLIHSPTQCRGCGKELGLQEHEAGSEREVKRKCQFCIDNECGKCEGTGKSRIQSTFDPNIVIVVNCPECDGTGLRSMPEADYN